MQQRLTTEPFPQGRYSYRLLHKARFKCYFLTGFWKLILLLSLFIFIPGVGAIVWLTKAEAISSFTIVPMLFMCWVGLHIFIITSFVLWAHHKAKHSPPLPGGETTLEWTPYALQVSVNGERRVYFWKDVHRYRFLGQSIVLGFPDGGRTGIFPDKVPGDICASLAAAIVRGKKANNIGSTRGNSPVIS